MEEQVKNIEKSALEELKNCTDIKHLEELRVKYLGKKGELTALLKMMGSLSKEERPVIGSLVNKVRDELEEIISSNEKILKKKEIEKKLESEKIDVLETTQTTETSVEDQILSADETKAISYNLVLNPSEVTLKEGETCKLSVEIEPEEPEESEESDESDESGGVTEISRKMTRISASPSTVKL